MSRRLFGILLLFVVIRLPAQFAPTRLYTENEGLPRTEVTSVTSDSEGRLLLGIYGKGICRFDGKTFETIFPQGMGSIGVLNTPKGELIWGHIGGGLYFIYPDGQSEFKAFGKLPLSKLTDTFLRGDLPGGGYDYNPLTGVLYFISRNYIFRYNTAQQAFVYSDSVLLPPDRGDIALHLDYWGRNHLVFVRDTNNVDTKAYQVLNGHLTHFYPPTQPIQEWRFHKVGNAILALHSTKGAFVKNKNTWRVLESVTERIKAGGIFNPVTKILANQHCLIELTHGDIHYLYDFTADFQHFTISTFKFKGRAIDFFQDKAGTYWIASHSGLLRIFPAFTTFYADHNAAMTTDVHAVVADHRNRLWFGTYSQGFGFIQHDTVYSAPPPLATYKLILPGSFRDREGSLFFSVEDRLTYSLIKIDTSHRVQVITKKIPGFIITKDQQGKILFGTGGNGLFIQRDSNCGYTQDCWIKIDTAKGLELENVIGVAQDQYGHYWMGRPSRGVAVYLPEYEKVINFLIQKNQTKYGGWTFATDKWGTLWIGTNKGLVNLNLPAKIDTNFNLDEHLQVVAPDAFGDKEITSIYNYHDSLLIISGTKLFGFVDLNAYYTPSQHVYAHVITTEADQWRDGSEQNAICEDIEGNIWFAHDKGITRFQSTKYFSDTFPPHPPRIVSFTSYGDTFIIRDNIVRGLRNKHTNIDIEFINDHSPFLYNNTFFKYQLNNDTFITTTENHLRFHRLAPGNYSFKLYAVKGNVRSEPLLLSFRIPPLWYQNPLILGGIILFLIFIIIIIIAWYQNKLKQERILGELKEQQERQRRELLTVRVQAIVNQLNPHFIINALTWLQVRAQRSNDLSSVSIIERLAENLKIIFINSREKRAFHTLWDEMQLVENYFRIQKVRFGDKVTYHLPDSELIKKWGQCVRVPLMLLLIHVENAIEHGLKKKRGGGCVNITIEDKSKDYLIFTIEDTGIGRKKAGEIPTISTRQGTKMLAELIAIFNSKNDQKITQYYEDEIFINSNGCPYGTRIIIQLPKIYTYALSD